MSLLRRDMVHVSAKAIGSRTAPRVVIAFVSRRLIIVGLFSVVPNFDRTAASRGDDPKSEMAPRRGDRVRVS